MSDIKIDPATGLPELPEGQYWHVSRVVTPQGPAMRITARKRERRRTLLEYTTDRELRDAYAAAKECQVRGWSHSYRSATILLEGWGTYPDMFRDDVEIVDPKCETREITRQRLFRKPEVLRTEYTWTGKLYWSREVDLFYGTTDEFTEEGLRYAAVDALIRHRESNERNAFVASVSGDYPPKRLEA